MAISNNTTGYRPGVCTSSSRPTAPYEGQMIFETDTNRVLVWDNAAWVMIADTDTPPGSQLVAKFTASGTSRSLDCDNVFTDEFQRYRIIGEVRSSIQTNGFFFQMRNSSGTALNTGYYSTAYGQDYASNGTGFQTLSANTVGYVGWVPNSTSSPFYYLNFSFDVFNTRSSANVTSWTGHHTGLSSGSAFLAGGLYGTRTLAEVNRGLVFDNGGAGNLTGAVSVYGYRD
jgi:hypothetical protein